MKTYEVGFSIYNEDETDTMDKVEWIKANNEGEVRKELIKKYGNKLDCIYRIK